MRERDFEAIERQRADMGLSDAQIAQRLGLTLNQVTLIRNVEEHRRFHTAHYHRLNNLGGGRRYRVERYDDPSDHHRYDEDATRLRSAMRFDPELARHYVEAGWWRDDTLRGWLAIHAAERGDAVALVSDDEALSYAELAGRVERLAGALYAEGLRPGDVVTIQLPNTIEFVTVYLAATHLGAVVSTLYLPHRRAEMRALLDYAPDQGGGLREPPRRLLTRDHRARAEQRAARSDNGDQRR